MIKATNQEKERKKEMTTTTTTTTKERVCVTGAGGYLASWVVQHLLSKGTYFVNGTVRHPSDEKNAHLKNLKENFQLFKADLLDCDSLSTAITGCTGVLHVACPVPSGRVANPEVDMIQPALTGTLNVLRACTEAKVKRVVIVSSVASVMMNPNWPKGQLMDESCWSDKEFCKKTENWYCYSKTEAESEALEYAKRNGLDIVTVCPSLIIGPMLQSTMNASSLVLVKILKDGCEEMVNSVRHVVDVRDVAEAVLLAYEKPEAEGRYICTAYSIRTNHLVEKLKSLYPHYNYPKKIIEGEEAKKLSSEKLEKLGWKYRPLEETLKEAVQSYIDKGLFD